MRCDGRGRCHTASLEAVISSDVYQWSFLCLPSMITPLVQTTLHFFLFVLRSITFLYRLNLYKTSSLGIFKGP
jgi:hypothetical protein